MRKALLIAKYLFYIRKIKRYLFTDLNKFYSKIKQDVTIKIKNRTVSLNGIGYVINLGGTCFSFFNDEDSINLAGNSILNFTFSIFKEFTHKNKKFYI